MQRPLGTLAARSVTKFHGPTLVLGGVSLSVTPGSRVGVVGPNGIGKSTLLRILAGLDEPEAGKVVRTPATLTVGYLPQEADVQPGEQLLDYLARRTGVAEAERKMDELARRLAGEPGLAAPYSEALERYLALGGGDFEARAGELTAEVGLPRSLDHYSGGEAARAALAAVLLARFDVFLLDEPTNNLDFDGLDRLEAFLASLPGGVVVVSHDRVFLDRVATRIVELDEWTRQAREYAGGWSEYEHVRAQELERHQLDYEGYVAERERIEGQAARMRAWEERGYGQGRKKKKTKDVKKAFEKKLGHLERVEKPFEPWRLRLELAPARRGGDVVARLEQAVVERGSFRLGPVDLVVGRGDRIAILGRNGSGKTTLLLALLGEVPLESGSRWIGPRVVLGQLPQGTGPFAGKEPLLDAFLTSSGLVPELARTLLAKFRLGADCVHRPGETLSPGERSRASLALLAARGVNCLALDEPTNHLDLPAIEELEQALEGFEGTVLLVTHDRRFLERFRATQTVEL
jgi:ATPase subunit of ABC transporter with duplicated ATPase domains